MATTLADRPTPPRKLSARRKKKNGIVLLMVVSLLALFLLMGVTFAVLAIQYKTAADVQAQKDRYGDPVQNEAELVLNQMLFEPLQPTSLSGHGFLRDIYGNDYVQYPTDFVPVSGGDSSYNVQILTAANQGGGQLLEVSFNTDNAFSPATVQPAGAGRRISNVPGYYNGRVLTIYASNIRQWVSSRIVQFIAADPNTSPYVARIYAETPVGDFNVQPTFQAGDPFVINGGPFNGTGAGFNPTQTANNMNAIEQEYRLPVALLPHYSAYPVKMAYDTADVSFTNGFSVEIGGADEPWDAADYQNMFMAFYPPRVVIDSVSNPLIPSYHRPELLNFWMTHATTISNASGGTPVTANPTTTDGKNLLRKIIFRPMPWDHTNFTGGNPSFDTTRGITYQQMLQSLAQSGGWNPVWDIDNDGDGIMDSIWIDPGLPVMTSPTGRRYKRLVAILVKDLDGRANLNVHGNLNYANTTLSRASVDIVGASPPLNLAGNPTSPLYLPRGFGYGPAEVDFCNILGGYGSASATYTNILTSRYRGQNDPTGRPGDDSVNDSFSAVKTLGMPDNHTTPELSIYSTPPDVWGRGAVAMDYFGQPAWQNMGTDEITDDPYEMQFDPQTATTDSPFNVADQEQLMRYPDADSPTINSRLLNTAVAGSVLATSSPGQINTTEHMRRESLTTMSYHVGGPRTFWRNDNRLAVASGTTRVRQGVSVLDLYYQRLSAIPAAQFAQQWRTMVPFELQHGEAFNLNRMFGNASQDPTTYDNLPLGNNRALIDDPSETQTSLEKIYGTYDFEHQNDAYVPAQPGTELFPLNPRVTYARHLYCLMMLIKSNTTGAEINVDADGDGTLGTARDTACALAQYAVNVVDFRDNDSIHTGFEYDVTPFDAGGWGVDGYLSTTGDVAGANRGVVWGVERPELLLTEAIALHDRRTANLMEGTPPETTVGAATNPDNDYDQQLRPKGSAFIELFNPWMDRSNNAYDHKPSELYYNSGVRLDATTADNRTPGVPTMGAPVHPVWRILVVRNTAVDDPVGTAPTDPPDPDSPEPESIATTNAVSIDRTIYFTNPTALPAGWAGDTTNRRFYPSIPGVASLSPLMPGRYAIVGSSGIPSGNNFVTYCGRPTTSTSFNGFTDQATTRRFILTPNTSANTNQFQVTGNKAPDVDTTQNQPAIAIPLNMPRSFSVSEPIGGYEGLGAAGASVWTASGVSDEPTTGGVIGGAYNPPIDTPLDKYRRDNGEQYDGATVMQDGTQVAFRTLFLQRLANPTLPWNRQLNPYITIDRTSLDLTAFNGLVDDTNDPERAPARTVNFQTLQRGGSDPAAGAFAPAPSATILRNLWASEDSHTSVTAASPPEMGNAHYFPYELFHTLGFINPRYAPAYTTGTAPVTAYVGAPTMTAANPSAFPWMTFNNRPFMSPIELLHVSSKSPSQLLKGYTVSDGTTATNGYANSADADPLFSHLFNFFQTSSAAGGFTTADGPLLARIMDYVETPSPFVGSERFYNPVHFNSTASGGTGVPTTAYRPPFGKLSRFRDPGKINVNSVAEPEVWRSLVDSYPTWSDYTALFLSRQGYPNPNTGMGAPPWGQISPNYPSIFSNPFRPAESADLMPNIPGVLTTLRQKEVDATLLRKLTNGPTDTNKPLFAATAIPDAMGTAPLAHNDPGRSPFLRYQPLQKIANNVTTNSNCFGVWITVGYFEVEENGAGIDQAHPDGFMLGQELNLDIGDTQRHRSFYLIDRSIPVGFIPGVKLNADNCVLLRRQID